MAKSKKADVLKTIVDATNSPTGYILVDPADSTILELVKSGKVELNATVTDGSGKVAARSTAAAVAPAQIVKASFDLQTVGLPAPAKRGGHREEIYPFSTMEVGQSFHIAATDAKPNPAESFASTVTGATRRFAVATGGVKKNRKGVEVPETKNTRKFVIRAVTAGQKYDNGFVETAAGARIYRTA